MIPDEVQGLTQATTQLLQLDFQSYRKNNKTVEDTKDTKGQRGERLTNHMTVGLSKLVS
jgi:hypothetical protein